MQTDKSEWSIDALVTRYEELSVLQRRALEPLESRSKVNRLGDQIIAISRAVLSSQRLGPLQRRAKRTISVAPGGARPVIQAIADSGTLPQSGHAGMYFEIYDGEMSRLLTARLQN